LRAWHRCAEAECLAALTRHAPLAPSEWEAARAQARVWIEGLRGQRSRGSGVDALMREFSLSSQEGVALMCLAEALARIPDRPTADALIRDKLAQGDWRAHLGSSRSIFVNAAAWGLMLTGRLVATHSEEGLGASVTRLIARGGEPLIRAGVDIAMRLLGQQFVLGRDIGEALERARAAEARGYRHSYDMLGEAALTAADAQRYFDAYGGAIDAIGASLGGAAGAPLHERPGISVKLSALHPRFDALQAARVQHELLPRIRELCRRAARWGIGLNIDAEESERLEPTLDLFAQLAHERDLAGWEGLGIVVQAYQKRAVPLVDWLVGLAGQARRRFMVRLVKGAYWDSEIKRAQIEGQAGFPVYTRKAHTDVSYLVAAQLLLRHPAAIYPQFATHNALTLSAVLQLARAAGVGPAQFELQCLHGMGETLYDMVLAPAPGAAPAGRPACRIYAPVGSHETLLAYLVRRLLENGANSSFVNRVVDERVPVEELLEDPLLASRRGAGTPHPAIALPAELYAAAPARRNARGMDLRDEPTLARLQPLLRSAAARSWTAYPLLAAEGFQPDQREPAVVRDPAQHARAVGTVHAASARDVAAALAGAADPAWSQTAPAQRAAVLEAVAEALEQRRDELLHLAVHEAGKTLGDAVSEVREAVDFCRYYAQQARALRPDEDLPLGIVVAISPWNFPLAIFVGQVAAALAAGNRVLAKPAEQTPLIAAHAVRLMHAAGVPRGALQLLPGDGAVGALLTQDPRIDAVLFTGSSEVAARIDRALADFPAGRTPLLVAETGGQNAMIVDSSAQPEQVVQDAVLSAFGSAGQRCSALRVLCLQEEAAEVIEPMLLGAVAELRIGAPQDLATDLGPVIDEDARAGIEAYLAAVAPQRCLLRPPLPAECAGGSYVAPAVLRIGAIGELGREVFGPVLHVLRYRREALGALLDAINATGYALTCGVHSRIDETIDFVAARVRAGNVYVNRNMIGAVVGVQPFGGEGLSGTGPKAGGPWTVRRLTRPRSEAAPDELAAAGRDPPAAPEPPALVALHAWGVQQRRAALVARCEALAALTPLRHERELAGPTGERNLLRYRGRGTVLCLQEPAAPEVMLAQLAAVLASGNTALLVEHEGLRAAAAGLPAAVRAALRWTGDWPAEDFAALLYEGPAPAAAQLRRRLAARPGARVPLLHGLDGAALLERLVAEQVVATNTAAAGGNASLMSLQPA
jgi:RHH-type proline utilization regulon transcriptional repressor/proline dehydrogenase/delta 1-pyrroline-5-carboxylate dehydrogenase